MNNPIQTIGTHNGQFHADEVFAVAILRELYPNANIIRTRNSSVLQACDIVVDVDGGQYDHHTTEKEYRENEIPFASAGLIWRDFGKEVIGTYASENHIDIEKVFHSIDESLFQGIDALDNGHQLDKDYRITGISDIISGFNLTWNSDEDEDEAFEQAVTFATQVLRNKLAGVIAKEEAKHIIVDALENRKTKELLILDTFCPWTKTLLELDEEEEVLFVVFPEKSGEHRIQVVPKEPSSFDARKDLPLSWAGKRDNELGDIVGISDAVFCHPARFIAGAVSYESIMKMAELALEER